MAGGGGRALPQRFLSMSEKPWIRSKEMKVGVSIDYSLRSKKMKGWRMRDGSCVAVWGEVLLSFFLSLESFCVLRDLERRRKRLVLQLRRDHLGSKVLKNSGN